MQRGRSATGPRAWSCWPSIWRISLIMGSGRVAEALIAEYELLLQAARDPDLEPLSRVFYDRIRGQLEETLSELGARDPRATALLIMAVLAGLEVDNLATPTTHLSRDELRQLIGQLLHGLLGSS